MPLEALERVRQVFKEALDKADNYEEIDRELFDLMEN